MKKVYACLIAGVVSGALLQCGDEGNPSSPPAQVTCGGVTCQKDEVCANDETCGLLECEVGADGDESCQTRFNVGFECRADAGSSEGGFCLRKETYCDAGEPCTDAQQECILNECLAGSGCTMEACADTGAFCSTSSACESPDTSCPASGQSGVAFQTGGTVIYDVREIDLEAEPEYAEGGDEVPADYADFDAACDPSEATVHAFRAQFYDPNGDMPTVSGRAGPSAGDGLYQRLTMYRADGTPTGTAGAVAAVIPPDDATEGELVFYACIQDTTASANDMWAVAYSDGDGRTSDAVCFDIATP